MGATEKILGMKIKRDLAQKKLLLCQEEYIQKMLNHFGMASTKPVYSPLTMCIHISELNTTESGSKREYMSCIIPYVSVVGSLMYPMVCTRPNLAQAINMVSSYMGKPGKEH